MLFRSGNHGTPKEAAAETGEASTCCRMRSGASAKSRDPGLTHRVTDLTEQIVIMVPEVMARIAALEHLLLEKHVCTLEDLVRAREFVRVQED